mmetsp:Transcript_14432/g.35300  ORF Transcript_14432/g.35300 Transcript_14432/m.35300 type:complete len:571 (+) Transcript_14432:322-2034(+)
MRRCLGRGARGLHPRPAVPPSPRLHSLHLLDVRLVRVRDLLERLLHRLAGALGDEGLCPLAERGQEVELVLLVGHLDPAGPLLEHLGDLFCRERARVVDVVVLSELVPQAKHGEDRHLGDRELREHRRVVLCPCLVLRLVVIREVTVIHRRVVVVCHVVILTKEVVVSVDDGSAVDARDVLAILGELDEAVERHIDEGEEEGHAAQGLDEDEEIEGKARLQGAPAVHKASDDEGGHDQPESDHAVAQHVVIVSHYFVGFSHLLEDLQAAVAGHVHKNPVAVEHQVADGVPLHVPHVERVPLSCVETVVQEDVRCREVERHVAIKQADPVFPQVPDGVRNVRLVQAPSPVVPLLMGVGVGRPLSPSSEPHPREVVPHDQPQGKRAVRELPVESQPHAAKSRNKGEQPLKEKVRVDLLTVDVLECECSQQFVAVDDVEDRGHEVLQAELPHLALHADGEHPEDHEVGREQGAKGPAHANDYSPLQLAELRRRIMFGLARHRILSRNRGDTPRDAHPPVSSGPPGPEGTAPGGDARSRAALSESGSGRHASPICFPGLWASLYRGDLLGPGLG